LKADINDSDCNNQMYALFEGVRPNLQLVEYNRLQTFVGKYPDSNMNELMSEERLPQEPYVFHAPARSAQERKEIFQMMQDNTHQWYARQYENWFKDFRDNHDADTVFPIPEPDIQVASPEMEIFDEWLLAVKNNHGVWCRSGSASPEEDEDKRDYEDAVVLQAMNCVPPPPPLPSTLPYEKAPDYSVPPDLSDTVIEEMVNDLNAMPQTPDIDMDAAPNTPSINTGVAPNADVSVAPHTPTDENGDEVF